MRRIIPVFVISILILSLCSCSGKKEETASVVESASPAAMENTAGSTAENGEEESESLGVAPSSLSGFEVETKKAEEERNTEEPTAETVPAPSSETDDASELQELFLGLICGSYVYEEEDELERRLFEVRCVDGLYFMEYEGEYEYAGAEIILSEGKAGSAEGDYCFDVILHPFSGFSLAGEYWNDGTACTMTVHPDGTLLISEGQPFLDRQELRLSRTSGRKVHSSESEVQENTGIDALIGSWRYCTVTDGVETGYYAEFARDGNFTLLKKTAGKPAEMYLGNFQASRSGEGITGDILCERFAYGGMPFEWKVRYDQEGYYPVIVDSYTGSQVLVSDNEKLPFAKVSAAYDCTAEPAGTDQDGHIISWKITVGSGMDQIITAAIDLETIYYPESADEMFYEDDVNFDGLSDLLIYRGTIGAQGVEYRDCYINAGDRFVRCEGFEKIPNPVPYAESHTLYGHIRDGAARYYEMTYEIVDFRAELTDETLFVYDEDRQEYLEAKE